MLLMYNVKCIRSTFSGGRSSYIVVWQSLGCYEIVIFIPGMPLTFQVNRRCWVSRVCRARCRDTCRQRSQKALCLLPVLQGTLRDVFCSRWRGNLHGVAVPPWYSHQVLRQRWAITYIVWKLDLVNLFYHIRVLEPKIRHWCSSYREGGGGIGQDHMHHHLYDVMQSRSAAFLHGRRLGCAFNSSWRVLHEKTMNELLISLYTLLRASTKQVCMRPCSLTKNISICRPWWWSYEPFCLPIVRHRSSSWSNCTCYTPGRGKIVPRNVIN